MNAPFPYYGGKHNLLPELMKIIPSNYWHYCEPFLGSGKLFFSLPPAPAETINDTNNKLITFYEVIKDPLEYEKLLLLCSKTLHSETQFKKAKRILKNGRGYKSIDIAWSVWCILIQSHTARLDYSAGWSTSDLSPRKTFEMPSKIRFHKINIGRIAKRLENVSIFCRDGLQVIKGADSINTFFFIDPPYPGSDQGHYKGYKMDDFLHLVEQLQKIKGKFLLSSGDYIELDRIAMEQGWNQKKIESISTAGKGARKKRVEVLTWNYTVQGKFDFEE